MEWPVNQNSYVPFLEVSVDYLNNIYAHSCININKIADTTKFIAQTRTSIL